MADDTVTVAQARLAYDNAVVSTFDAVTPAERLQCEADVKQAWDALIAAVRAEDATCATCQHWLPWHRADAAKPHVSTKGDCTHPLLRGHLNGIDQTFGCRFHGLR